MTTEIPKDRKAAIAAIVEDDVVRWGESDRAAAERQYRDLSYGRLLNTLANRAELDDRPDPALRVHV